MFYTYYNYFKYAIMSFNFINVFAIFQFLINKALKNLINHFYIIYLNDIFIYFKIKKNH